MPSFIPLTNLYGVIFGYSISRSCGYYFYKFELTEVKINLHFGSFGLVKRVPTTMIRFENAFLIEIGCSTYARFNMNSKYQFEISTIACINVWIYKWIRPIIHSSKSIICCVHLLQINKRCRKFQTEIYAVLLSARSVHWRSLYLQCRAWVGWGGACYNYGGCNNLSWYCTFLCCI